MGLIALAMIVTIGVGIHQAYADFQLCKHCFNHDEGNHDNGGNGGNGDYGSGGGSDNSNSGDGN